MQKTLLIFDVYGTIISTGNGSVSAVEKILALQEKPIDAKAFYKEWKRIHWIHMDEVNAKADTDYFLTEEEIFAQDLQELYKSYGIRRDYRRDVKIMLDSLVGRVCFDDVKEVLEKLRRRYRVVLGSTTDTAPLLQNMKANDIEVDAVYTSEMIKKYKPDAEFYRYILQQEGYEAKNSFFVGDSLVDDVYGPKQVGIKTVLIDRLNKFNASGIDAMPDYAIHNFGELLKLNL